MLLRLERETRHFNRQGSFMKIQLSAVLIAALALSGCAQQTDTAKSTPGATVADASQAGAKKKCAGDATTGSRLHSCNGMTADAVSGESGDDYRNAARTGTAGAKNN